MSQSTFALRHVCGLARENRAVEVLAFDFNDWFLSWKIQGFRRTRWVTLTLSCWTSGAPFALSGRGKSCFVPRSHRERFTRNKTEAIMALIMLIWRWFGVTRRFLPACSGLVASCAGWKNADGVVLSGCTGVEMSSDLGRDP